MFNLNDINLSSHSLLFNDESLDNNFSFFNNNQTLSDNPLFFNEYNENILLTPNEYNNFNFLNSQPIEIEEKNEIPLNFDFDFPSPKNDKLNVHQSNNIEIKSTALKTIQSIVPIINEKIFKVEKVKKKMLGRKRKNDFYINKNSHTKMFKDNIRTKLKKKLYNNILKLSNLQIEKSQNEKIKHLKLRKIDDSFIKVSKKEENLQFLEYTVKQLFSNKLSKKYKNYNKDSNKNIINFIFEQKEKNLIDIFNKKIKEILEIYCDNKDRNDIFKDFKRLKDDLEDFKKKGEKQSYIDSFEENAKNFENNIKKIYPRRKRSKNLN